MKNKTIILLMGVVFLLFYHNSSAVQPQNGWPIQMPASPYRASPVPTPAEYATILDSAEKGDPESQLYIGFFYANGDVVKQDFSKAAKWYKLAANSGYAKAQYYLGLLYECGVGVERDYAMAFNLYAKAVAQNDLAAHFGIAGFHFACRISYLPRDFGDYGVWRLKPLFTGKIISSAPSYEENFWKSYHTTHKYYQNDWHIFKHLWVNAQNGDSEVLLQLAIMSLHAQGVPRDIFMVNFFVNEAANSGNPYAKFILGAVSHLNKIIKVPPALNKRINLLKEASTFTREPYFTAYYYSRINFIYTRSVLYKGQVDFSYKAFCDYYGFDLKINFLTFLGPLSALAEKGDADAQSVLSGYIKTFQKDRQGIFHWIQLAAQNGHKYAKVRTGLSLLFGNGTNRNMEKGLEYLDKALSTNDGELLSQLNIGFYGLSISHQSVVPQVLADLQQAYASGHKTAALYIGLLFENDEILKDKAEAARWYIKACLSGVMPAAMYIKSTYSALYKDHWNIAILDSIYGKPFILPDKFPISILNMRPENLIVLPAALADYGPAVLDLVESLNWVSSDGLSSTELFLNSLFSLPNWYNVTPYQYGDLCAKISGYYRRINEENYPHAKEPKDDEISLFYKIL